MSLTALLASLDVHSANDQHLDVLKTATSVLSKSPSNVHALKQALIALISMDNYSKAASLIGKHSELVESNAPDMVVELAYIYYKLDDTKRLLALNDLVSSVNSRPYNHILAQHYYKIGENAKAWEIYKSLVSANVESEQLDLAVNERAVISQLLFENQSFAASPVSNSSSTSYDQLFNDALIMILRKDYENAILCLEKTLSLAKASFGEEDGAEFDLDKFLEITPIIIQIAYVYILLSQKSKALSILEQIVLPPDALCKTPNVQILILLINNNKLACKDLTSANPSLVIRELDLPNSLSVSASKLTIPQMDILRRNSNLVAKHAGKSTCLYSSTEEVALLKAQRAVLNNNLQAAVHHLSTTSVTHPAIGKLLYTLYSKLECKSSIHKLLKSIYEDLIQRDSYTAEEVDYATFVSLKLMATDEESSKNLLSKVNKLDILSKSFNSEEVDSLIENVDVESLVDNGIAPLLSNAAVSSANKLSLNHNNSKRRLRSKPNKLPKNLSAPVDNERWLPLKDRSYYKAKKSKKNKLTQGGAIDSGSEKVLDMNASAKSELSPPPTTPSSSSNSKNKKKKKGKK